MSYLGDLQRSAKAGVPVYRLGGGAGFLWAATFKPNGRGVLRFLTIDASKIASSTPSPDPSTTSGSMLKWRDRLIEILSRNKRYPAEAVRRGEEGTVFVSFTLDHSGHLIDSRIRQSSGSTTLDHEVIDLLSRTQPFPPLPTDFSGAQISLDLPIRFDLAQLDQVLRLGEDLKILNEKIDQRGRDLLDAKTSSQLAELDNLFKALSTMAVPFSEEGRNKLANARTTIQEILGKIDNVLERGAERKEIAHKGQEYANKGESLWRLLSKNNPMTDRTDVWVKSVQKNDDGVIADVKGYCETNKELGDVTFSALIVDDQGQPSIELPQTPMLFGGSGTPASIRLNDNQPQTVVLLPRSNFRNELLVASLARSPQLYTSQKIPLSDIWRIFVQFDTSRQPMLIRIPMYDDAIQKMINSCG